jgi:hypothetical protein
VKIFMPPGAIKPVYAPYVEHLPPNIWAAKLWLLNRQPGRWRERREIDVTLTLEQQIIDVTLTLEQQIAAMTPEKAQGAAAGNRSAL